MSPRPLLGKSRPVRRQPGFSLVELMVALALGLTLLLVISYAYLGSKQTFRVQDALSRMQENARFVFETMAFDIRMAGFGGCHAQTAVNVLSNATEWDKDLLNFPLVGYEGGVSTFPTGVAGNILRGDALTVLRASEIEYIVQSDTSPTMTLTTAHNIQQYDIVVATDCSHQAIFQMTGPGNANNTATTISRNGGLNSSVNLGSGGVAYSYAAGSRIMQMNGVNYFIRNNASGEPALVRLRRTGSNGTTMPANAADWAKLELAEGIQDMQITYGVDTTTPNADGVVDTYLRADEVAGIGPGATLSEKWQRVLSVRIALLMASTGSDAYTAEPQTYTFNGTTTTPNDRRLRKVFNTTIAVRNRLP
jgi:type IV pilus assembly protein PilW